MFDRDAALQIAHELFGLGSKEHHRGLGSRKHHRGKANKSFIETPARLTADKLVLDRDQSTRVVSVPSPSTFLSGRRSDAIPRWFRQPERQQASFSIIVGEYGLGKTELMFRAAEASIDEPKSSRHSACLPIALASARKLGSLSEARGPIEFMRGLLEPVLQGRSFDLDEAARDFVNGVRRGDIMLLLDALDELVSERTGHDMFLESVGNMVAGSDSGNFHIVLSMRLEHLLHVSGDQLGDVAASLQKGAGAPVPVNFLLLEFFDDSTVEDYIAFRTDDDDFVDALPAAHRFRDMLRRPLLARIFCDLLSKPISKLNQEKLIKKIEDEVDSPASLLELFTKEAGRDGLLLASQNQIRQRFAHGEHFIWKHALLAKTALDVYRRGDWLLNRADIGMILVEADSGHPANPNELAKLSPLALEKCIYKCPFLSRASGQERAASGNDLRIQFTHRVFFEYFTTKGIVAELTENLEQLHAFHDLVLNIDMHKFLRDLTVREWSLLLKHKVVAELVGLQANTTASDDLKPNPDLLAFVRKQAPKERPERLRKDAYLWYLETGRAYGLEENHREEWDHFGGLSSSRRDELDVVRRDLLDIRSRLSRALKKGPDAMKTAVENYLKLDEAEPLHPRYQIPNYEAVAVCLLDPAVGTRSLHKDFSDLLETRMGGTSALLNVPDSDIPQSELTPVYELLVERLLDVGHRCRYPWVHSWSSVTESCELQGGPNEGTIVIRDNDTRRRIDRVLGEIRRRPYLGDRNL